MSMLRDPLTEPPPPSRFDPDDLDVFGVECSNEAASQAVLPPFIAWSRGGRGGIKPRLLIVCVSEASCTLIHHLPGKRIVGSVLLPEIAMAGNAARPCVHDRTCCIYALGESIMAAAVQYKVPAERSYDWTRVLFREIEPESTLVLGTVQEAHFRSRLLTDESMLFVVETDEQKARDAAKGFKLEVPFLPSGSLVDGVAGSILTHCQVRGLPARLLLPWPPGDVRLLGEALSKSLGLPEALGFAEASKARLGKQELAKYELYT